MESGGILVHENWRNVTIPHGIFKAQGLSRPWAFFLLRWMATRSDVWRATSQSDFRFRPKASEPEKIGT